MNTIRNYISIINQYIDERHSQTDNISSVSQRFITESKSFITNTSALTGDTLWFRGTKYGLPSSALSRVYTRPDSDLPSSVNELFVHTDRIYRLMRSYPFKISKTYAGMSNWGFGVYFSNRLSWASRYGSTITVVNIDPDVILTIRDFDFANRTDGTTGGELAKIVYGMSDNMSEQAKSMYSAVKKIKKNAKALFVQTHEDGDGQLCVFNKEFIIPGYGFDLKSHT